jgi:hypothetical protein
MSRQIHTCTELKQQIHEDLRLQHPEWIEPGGECPKCDEHEARLRELFEAPAQTESNTDAAQQLLVEDQVTQSSPRDSLENCCFR